MDLLLEKNDMKTIIKLLCLLCLVIFAWSAPGNNNYEKYERILNILFLALKSSANLSFGGSIKAVCIDKGSIDYQEFDFIFYLQVDICPKVKCMAVKQPCANIQRYYTVINGQKCPMCLYCASSTTPQP